jgi:hypothetical protein
MTKKPAKKAKPAARRATPKLTTSARRSALPPVASSAPTETGAAAPAAPPAPMRRARLLTPAQKRGSELVRYLRIHTKTPYGARGQRAIVELAKEVGHLARVELDAIATE